MGCCGSSATSPGPSSRSFTTAPGGGQTASAPAGVLAEWRVTFRDGSVSWFTNQIVAYAEAGVNGGAVDYIPGGDPGATVIPAQ